MLPMWSVFKSYWRPFLLLLILFGIGRFLPQRQIDPWGLLNTHKILQLIFALSLIQVMGDILLRVLGTRVGTIVLGFFGGLVSSTAFTASLAKESKSLSESESKTASLSFLSATLAMIVEAILLVFYGAPDFHPKILILFSGPVGMTVMLIFASLNRSELPHPPVSGEASIDFRSVFKLTGFIFLALSFSKILEHFFGPQALLILTLIVSFFEIHGAVIANVQLHDAGVVSVQLLGDLLAISLTASYLSKLFLVMSLGSTTLKRQATHWTIWIASATVISWIVFRFL